MYVWAHQHLTTVACPACRDCGLAIVRPDTTADSTKVGGRLIWTPGAAWLVRHEPGRLTHRPRPSDDPHRPIGDSNQTSGIEIELGQVVDYGA